MTATLLTPPTPADGPAPPDDPFFGYDRPATYEVHVARTEVPVRDGSHLACDLHRPADADGTPATGRFPVIVYDYTAYDALEQLGEAARFYVTRGYVAAVCNARGSGDSPGHLDPFGPQEQRDNYDLIEWLGVQPWSNGRVGQMGLSYGGHSTLLVAVNKPPHLAAIIPVDGISDWYENTIYRGGIYSARIREWQRNTAPDTLVTYAEHPLYDDFWRARSVKARWSDLDVPTLEVAGWYDRYRDGMVRNFLARQDNVWLVAGPWEHGWPAGQYADIGTGGFLAWWDHWLAGRPAPLPAKKVTSFETPDGGWHQYDEWPPGDTRRLSFARDGELKPGGIRPIRASYEVNTDEGPRTPGEGLEFRTRPLRHDLVLAGGVEATIRAAFPATDGALAVIVDDVAPDGTRTRVTNGWLRASHRFGHERAVPVRPGVGYELDVHLWPTHRRVAAGHHLEVTVASDDYPEIDSDAPPGRVTITGGTIEITTTR
ncbi:CocE/NonD family hydrolase [Actinophytocola sp. S1-96]|uniref:CocE/NonD family hydrolase n=2 Tax=Actinophytocola gossypii TaxID=2812003 RepID=A0ABT2J2N4_9PSEU|nr:CocE/NonD family hydrolase [Actinophytocola gossypii]